MRSWGKHSKRLKMKITILMIPMSVSYTHLDSLLKVSLYLLANFGGQYLDKPLDGMETEEVVEALTAYFHNILDVMLKNGWMIEGGDPYLSLIHISSVRTSAR